MAITRPTMWKMLMTSKDRVVVKNQWNRLRVKYISKLVILIAAIPSTDKNKLMLKRWKIFSLSPILENNNKYDKNRILRSFTVDYGYFNILIILYQCTILRYYDATNAV